jgi:hypothetical protein
MFDEYYSVSLSFWTVASQPEHRPGAQAARRLRGLLRSRDRPRRAPQADRQSLRARMAEGRSGRRRQAPHGIRRLLHLAPGRRGETPKRWPEKRGDNSGSDGGRTRDLCRDRVTAHPASSGNVRHLQGERAGGLTPNHAAGAWDVRQECVDAAATAPRRLPFRRRTTARVGPRGALRQ